MIFWYKAFDKLERSIAVTVFVAVALHAIQEDYAVSFRVVHHLIF